MSIDIRTATGVEALAALLMTAAKVQIESIGRMLPVAFVSITSASGEMGESVYEFGNTIPIVANDPFDEAEKERWLAEIRKVAFEGKAICIITIGEALMVKVPSGSIEEFVRATGGRLDDHEERQEIVAVDMEHASLGLHSWSANILRGDLEKVKLSPFKERPHLSQQGRFSNLLKR